MLLTLRTQLVLQVKRTQLRVSLVLTLLVKTEFSSSRGQTPL